jgi:hypothetical protein
MANNPQASTATNLTGPVASQSTLTNPAPRYFNNFYSAPFNVSGNTNAAINAFFEEYADNPATARALAASVLYTAQAAGLNPLTILAQFQALPKGELTSYLIAFLNSNRVPTSVLGVKKTLQTSPYVTRTILL